MAQSVTTFDRAAILRDAWASYRLARPAIYALGDEHGIRAFLPRLFAKMLSAAWDRARKAHRNVALTVTEVAEAVNLSAAVKAKRIADIDAALIAMDYSDAPTNWSRKASLRAERAQIAA